MNDEFMYRGLRKPPTALMREVRDRLRPLEVVPRARWELRVAACGAFVAIVVSLAVVPAVRVRAQAFLDLFRVVNFVALPVKRDHIAQLAHQQGLDLPTMISEQVKVLNTPTVPQSVSTPEAAGVLAGMRVLLPTIHPAGTELQRMDVVAEQGFAVTASSRKLHSIEEAFGIDDLPFPSTIDGKTANVYIHPVVHIVYSGNHRQVTLIESRQPQVSLPDGLDLTRLAELGLRVIGMNSGEAYRFAQQIDWRTTVVVPVPADVTDLRDIQIQGNRGLMISRRVASGESAGAQSQLLWSTPEAVYALSGNVLPQELVMMAQSLQ